MTTDTKTDVRAEIERQWKSRAVAQDYQPGTQQYRDAECEFFIGAMTAMSALGLDLPAYWMICIMSGRPVTKEE